MTAEETIQALFDYHPRLFQDRADCLNQMFCTIGNGMFWENGNLIDLELPPPASKLCDGKAVQHQRLSLRDQARQTFENTTTLPASLQQVYDDELEKYLSTIPNDIFHQLPRKDRWYFKRAGLCEKYAYLYHYPDDIKPDWLALIEECKTMLLEDGYPIDTVVCVSTHSH